MSEQKWGMRKIEQALVTRLRAWYWHLEVERLASEYFYSNNPTLIEAKLKAKVYALIAGLIHFFMEDKALLLESSEPPEPPEPPDIDP